MVALFVGATVDAMQIEHVNALQAQWLFVVVISSVPLFAVHGTITGFLDGYMQGKFVLPPSAAQGPVGSTPTNPWRAGMLATCLLGLPLSLAGYTLIPSYWPHVGLSLSRFTWWLAAVSGVLAALVTLARSGPALLRDLSVPPERRRFEGSLDAYIWQRHVVPQFLVNLWFNAWAALSLVQGPASDPSSSMALDRLVPDAFVSSLGLAFGIGLGTRAYARVDLRWGIVAPGPATSPGPLRATLLMTCGALSAALLGVAMLYGFGIERLHTVPLAAVRGLFCGGVCACVAYFSARWTLDAPGLLARGRVHTTASIAASASSVAATSDPAP